MRAWRSSQVAGGWISVEMLLAAATRPGHDIGRGTLAQILNAPGKRRFETRGGLIRAAQGHSVPVDLQLAPRQPRTGSTTAPRPGSCRASWLRASSRASAPTSTCPPIPPPRPPSVPAAASR